MDFETLFIFYIFAVSHCQIVLSCLGIVSLSVPISSPLSFYPFLHWLWTNILRIMLTGNVDMIRVDKCLPGLGLGGIPLNKMHQLSEKIEL